MVTVYSPLTWGIYTTPPPDIPECGFVGEFCIPPARGEPLCLFTKQQQTMNMMEKSVSK